MANPQSKGVALSWNHINVSVPPKKSFFTRKTTEAKTILNDVCGAVEPGSLLAIMGASGSGKSTLLNVLTSRISSDLVVSGVVKVNGKRIGRNISKISAYVQQDDLFFGVLTVREHLSFQAMLRMDPKLTMADRERRIEEVIAELGLSKCADTVIGSPDKLKSISGGERKRLSFASEILTNPALMFCDEPTTGLDSFMAENVIQTLRTTASHGKTILCTIHQPSSQIFALFDSLMLLANGNLVYMGSTKGARDFFASVGLICPTNFNPADFYINALATLPGQEQESIEKVERISRVFVESAMGHRLNSTDNTSALEKLGMIEPSASSSADNATDNNSDLAPIDFSEPYKTGMSNQFRRVIWRSFATNMRARDMVVARICQTLIIAIFTGLLYLRQENNQKGVQNINGAIFLIITNSTFSNAYSVFSTFPNDLPIVKREHQAGMYSTFVYYLSKMIVDIIPFTILPVVFATILYWMVGLKSDVDNFFIFVATMVYLTHVVVSFGYFISCAAGDAGVATVIASPIIVPLMLFSGFILNDASIPPYFIWLAHVSWFKYANEILCLNQWHNYGKIGCEYNNTLAGSSDANNSSSHGGGFASRCFDDGEQVLIQLNYNMDNYATDFIALAVLFVGFRLLGYFLLVLRVGRLRPIRPSKNTINSIPESDIKVVSDVESP